VKLSDDRANLVKTIQRLDQEVREGRKFTDSETGHTVHVSGDRVVITNAKGEIVTQFRNSRANTQQRISNGKWIPQ